MLESWLIEKARALGEGAARDRRFPAHLLHRHDEHLDTASEVPLRGGSRDARIHVADRRRPDARFDGHRPALRKSGRTLASAQERSPASAAPALMLCKGLRARRVSSSALSRWTSTSALLATARLLSPPVAAEVSASLERTWSGVSSESVASRTSSGPASALLVDHSSRLARAAIAVAFVRQQQRTGVRATSKSWPLRTKSEYVDGSRGVTALGRLRNSTEFALLLADRAEQHAAASAGPVSGVRLQAPDSAVALWALACRLRGDHRARIGRAHRPTEAASLDRRDLVAAPIRPAAAVLSRSILASV